MGNVYFFTGFPGFIAGCLIKKLVEQDAGAQFELLIHPSQMDKARRDVEWLTNHGYGSEHQYVLIAGDITRPNLGIDSREQTELEQRVTHVFHLAAIYDLAVPEDRAYRVNILGTKHVNEWVLSLKKLQRYVYFSTAYVAGTRPGTILETELDKGQSFKNHYESTKFEAERLVQRVMERVPTTIIRPGIVVGDSTTGETVKFDGPYFIMRFLDRIRKFPIPRIGRGAVPINLVPVDYIVDATLYLSQIDTGKNKVYHLTDPSPYTVREVYDAICRELLDKKPFWRLPVSLVRWMLSIPPVRRYFGVEKETMDYFEAKVEYDCTQAQQDLSGSGISCPDLMDVVPIIVDYYQKHRHDQEKIISVR
ncbi:MAG: SDR family oxidoreductase [Bacillaceae bacterium]|nr:SDR family oxidoreductase [Bacillaceae bacterium]